MQLWKRKLPTVNWPDYTMASCQQSNRKYCYLCQADCDLIVACLYVCPLGSRISQKYDLSWIQTDSLAKHPFSIETLLIALWNKDAGQTLAAQTHQVISNSFQMCEPSVGILGISTIHARQGKVRAQTLTHIHTCSCSVCADPCDIRNMIVLSVHQDTTGHFGRGHQQNHYSLV